jgi:hypothetical protein
MTTFNLMNFPSDTMKSSELSTSQQQLSMSGLNYASLDLGSRENVSDSKLQQVKSRHSADLTSCLFKFYNCSFFIPSFTMVTMVTFCMLHFLIIHSRLNILFVHNFERRLKRGVIQKIVGIVVLT